MVENTSESRPEGKEGSMEVMTEFINAQIEVCQGLTLTEYFAVVMFYIMISNRLLG